MKQYRQSKLHIHYMFLINYVKHIHNYSYWNINIVNTEILPGSSISILPEWKRANSSLLLANI